MRRALFACLLALCLPSAARAQPAEAGAPWDPFPTDFPFASSCVTAPYPAQNTAHKAVSIRLGGGAVVAFDTDLLRMAAGWTGGFLSPTGVALDTSHGGHPRVIGEVRFGTRPLPGWANDRSRFEDPRRPGVHGPLPEGWGRWDGLHVSGETVILGYTVLGAKIFERPSAHTREGRTAFVRTFRIADAPRPLTLRVADVDGPGSVQPVRVQGSTARIVVARPDRLTGVSVVGAPAGAVLEATAQGRVTLRLPAGKLGGLFQVITWGAPPAERAAYESLATGVPAPERTPEAFMAGLRGGPRHWPQAIVTRGERGTGPGSYVVDRLTTPFPGTYHRSKITDWKDNVYKRRLMIGGFDFFSDGKRAAVATWEGDVWIVEGIDDDLRKLTWRRFASGGYETLGLKIVDDIIYTSGRDQITRYHDLNGDGEADHYENFNNQVTSSTGFHEFQFDLHTDDDGNFYTAKAGPVRAGGRGFGGGGGNGVITPFAGTIQKISKDGKRREVYATGLRAPNGIGVSPGGQVTAGDNEGTWVPTSPLHWVKPGAFLGVEDTAQRTPIPAPAPPLCWISKAYDNSGGGQVWVTSKRWGPFEGELLHLSYGRASVYAVLPQAVRGEAGEIMQGGIVRILGGSDAVQLSGTAQKLTSSAMRARFNPRDGQLYVAGLAGWQTDAVAVTGFDRVRYTGAEVHSVRGLRVTAAGVFLTFSHPLDPASVGPQNFSGERWNYRRTSAYGSPELSVSEPDRRGHDRLDILEATLSADGRTVRLLIDDLRPAHQMLLKFRVKAQDGTRIAQTVMHTIHVVPPDPSVQAGPNVATRRGRAGLSLTISGVRGGRDVMATPRVALYVAAGRAPSPLVAPGRFRAVWEGTLSPELEGQHAFAAELAGTLKIEVGGQTVYEATGRGGAAMPGPSVLLKKRENEFRATFTAPARGDAFVRLAWRDDRGGPFQPISPSAFRQGHETRSAETEAIRLGRALFLEHRCARCHLARPPGKGAPELTMDAPSFDGIGARRNPAWMAGWMRQVRPGATMPVLLHGEDSEEDARAIAAFLATQATTGPGRTGLAAPSRGDPAEGERLWNELACTGCHSPLLQMLSDDGKLSLRHVRAKFPEGALAAFLRAPEAHYAWTRMPNFRLTPEEAASLAAYLEANAEGGGRAFPSVDAATVARGRSLVESSGCLACHALAGARNRLAPVDLVTRLRAGAGSGPRNCVDGKTPAARYELSPPQRAALRAFLASGAESLASLGRHAPAEFVARQTRDLQCEACHGQIEGFPALEQIGDKLRPEWTASFIAGQVPYKPRPERHADGQPWLAARMPAFPARAALLAEGLAASHGFPPRTPPERPIDRAAARDGEALVSATGGFSCVTCHAVGNSAATQVFETEGINLAHAADRLLPSFFRRWLRNPLAVDPQTKMPVYFDEEGRSPITTVLGGDGDKQIEALWQYVRQLSGRSTTR